MFMTQKIKGVISALVTPFYKGEVDFESLENLIRYQLKNGIDGFVINGTTAESPTLTWSEISDIFKKTRTIVGPDFPLILGTGSNSTKKTIEDTRKAFEIGANAVLVVVPYYNKPPQRGLIQHFNAIAAESKLPIILYNVPGRTITAMTNETILQIANTKNILGIKEASGDLKQDADLFKHKSENFIMLTGDDPTYIEFMQLGGHGVISVMSNLLTAECAHWTKLCSTMKFDEAKEDFKKYSKLIQLMYCEANPIPIKWMLYKKGIIKSPELRLPLVELDEKFHNEILNEMTKVGIL